MPYNTQLPRPKRRNGRPTQGPARQLGAVARMPAGLGSVQGAMPPSQYPFESEMTARRDATMAEFQRRQALQAAAQEQLGLQQAQQYRETPTNRAASQAVGNIEALGGLGAVGNLQGPLSGPGGDRLLQHSQTQDFLAGRLASNQRRDNSYLSSANNRFGDIQKLGLAQVGEGLTPDMAGGMYQGSGDAITQQEASMTTTPEERAAGAQEFRDSRRMQGIEQEDGSILTTNRDADFDKYAPPGYVDRGPAGTGRGAAYWRTNRSKYEDALADPGGDMGQHLSKQGVTTNDMQDFLSRANEARDQRTESRENYYQNRAAYAGKDQGPAVTIGMKKLLSGSPEAAAKGSSMMDRILPQRVEERDAQARAEKSREMAMQMGLLKSVEGVDSPEANALRQSIMAGQSGSGSGSGTATGIVGREQAADRAQEMVATNPTLTAMGISNDMSVPDLGDSINDNLEDMNQDDAIAMRDLLQQQLAADPNALSDLGGRVNSPDGAALALLVRDLGNYKGDDPLGFLKAQRKKRLDEARKNRTSQNKQIRDSFTNSGGFMF